MKFLPDTNILIYVGEKHPIVSTLFDSWLDNQQVAISVVTVSEFIIKASSSDIEYLQHVINVAHVFNVDMYTAKLAAQYRKQSLKNTRTHLLDCYLAATAKLHDLTLVTRNTADFPMTDIHLLNPFA